MYLPSRYRISLPGCYDGAVNKSTVKRIVWISSAWVLFLISLVVSLAWMLDASYLTALNIVQSAFTILAIGFGGVFALYKFEVFREFRPHLTVSQIVTHRKVGDKYIHVSSRVQLVNTSKVKIEIRNASFRMQQVAPFPDSEVEQLFREFNAKPADEKYIPFPTIAEYDREWERDEFVIEPGETEAETYEFIVEDVFNTVSLYAFFNDQTTGTSTRDQKGWAVESVYDIR